MNVSPIAPVFSRHMMMAGPFGTARTNAWPTMAVPALADSEGRTTMTMTRKEASEKLLLISIKFGEDLNSFLISIKPMLSKEDFYRMRDVVAALMGDIFSSAISPIVNEFPELKPDKLV